MSATEFWRNGELSNHLQSDIKEALMEVDRLTPEEVLDVDPTQIIDRIASRFANHTVTPQWQDLQQSKTREIRIQGQEFGRNVEFNGLAIDYTLPVTGDIEILKYRAGTSSPSPMPWKIQGNKLVLTIAKTDLTAEHVKAEFERSRVFLNNAIEWANRDVAANETAMRGQINQRLASRSDQLKKARRLDEGLKA